ncbi:MAG TPA: Rieske (2Fe-2S) protein [Actinomycetales bacterium]|jgi:Rieske Fe-S protein|nr:Rieske (2Fe-2S) protein [Actinomycetales bacterium]
MTWLRSTAGDGSGHDAGTGEAASGLARRQLLVAGGTAVVVGGALAACGDGRPARSAAPAPTAGATLVAASDVPVGGGVILADAQMVVTQPTSGEFKGFSYVCTHAGCPVTQVTDGVIVCPCHGSRFSIATGAPEPGSPAKQPLASRAVTEKGGEVVAG